MFWFLGSDPGPLLLRVDKKAERAMGILLAANHERIMRVAAPKA